MTTTISVRLPDSFHRAVRASAKKDSISMNQWIASAVGEKLSALQTEEYLEMRAARSSREKFEAAMLRVPDIEPEPYDSLD